MRHLLATTALLSTLSAAAAAEPPPLCAIPAADTALSHQVSGPAPASAKAESPAPSTAATLPPTLASILFVQHVAASGATIADLGEAHGLHRVVAHTGGEFMIFQLAPDGQAAVSGAAVEISADEINQIAGAANITPLGEQHGFKGFFVRSGGQFQVFYATPDQQRLIPGVLWDATGKDLTRQQVAGIPGAVPTVEVTAGAQGGSSVPALPLVEKAAFGLTGGSKAPRIYMLIDPQCIYSVRAMQMLKPFVDAGRLQVAVVPLSVLDYEDKGESTRAALSLLSKPADQIVTAWQARDLSGTPSSDATQRLQTNMQVAEALRVRGTPTFVWRKPDGTEGRIDGMPENVPALVASLGS